MRKTIFLLLAAIGLAAYVYVYEIEGGQEREMRQQIAEKLFRLDRENLVKIDIITPERHTVFRKASDVWEIESPVRAETDDTFMSAFLHAVSNAKVERSFTPDKNELIQYGISGREITIVLEGKNGDRETVKLGDEAPVGGNIYALSSDTLINITKPDVKKNALKSLFEMRDKKIIKFENEKIHSMVLKNRYGIFEFEKSGNEWQLKSPIKTKADQSVVSILLNKLRNGKIKEIYSEEKKRLSRYGVSVPAVSIELLNSTNELESKVSFSDPGKNTIYGIDAKRPIVFSVDSSYVNMLNKKLYDFRYKKIVDFDDQKIDRINLLYKGNLLTLHRDSLKMWAVESGENVGLEKVRGILNSVKNLTAKKIVAENPSYLLPYGLTSPTGLIELFSGDMRMVELEIGIRKKGIIYFRNPLVGDVVAVDDAVLENIFKSKQYLIAEKKAGEDSEK